MKRLLHESLLTPEKLGRHVDPLWVRKVSVENRAAQINAAHTIWKEEARNPNEADHSWYRENTASRRARLEDVPI